MGGHGRASECGHDRRAVGGDAPPGEPLAQDIACPGHPAANGADRPSEPPGGLVVRHPFEVAEHHRGPQVRGEPRHLLIDDRCQLAALGGIGRRSRGPTLDRLVHRLLVDEPARGMGPPRTETRETIKANPNITLIESVHGGHCAFLAEPDVANAYDGYWAEHTLLRFLLAHS